MDNHHSNVICHKQSYLVLLFKRLPDTQTGVPPDISVNPYLRQKIPALTDSSEI
jgi:hypothetical protein